MIPNLLWTTLFLTPPITFCYTYLTSQTTYILLGVSLIPIFFPNSFFDRIQLSQKSIWYKRIGVKYINSFAQNGRILSKIIKKKYPNFKVISRTKTSIKRHYLQTYYFEKFHFALFLFFIFVTLYAGFKHHFYWGSTVTICNLLYNIYPNLLQQYIRIKLKSSLTAKSLS